MKVTIYLNGMDTVPTNVREIRSSQSHILLAYISDGSLLLYDRKSRLQHSLTVDDLLHIFSPEQVQAALQRQQQKNMLKEQPTDTPLNAMRITG